MQHLPSVPSVLRFFFLHVHQTNIPATARAATDPNAAPIIIHTVPTKRDKLEINFWKSVSSQTQQFGRTSVVLSFIIHKGILFSLRL